MSNIQRPLSLLDALMRVVASEHRPEPRPARGSDLPPAVKGQQPTNEHAIVDPRDQSGGRHTGDFPNPAAGTYKGCF
jgi:hypothetical protein